MGGVYCASNFNNEKIMPRQFKPRKDEWYWFINERGSITCTPNWNTPVDAERIKNGNCFKSKREIKLKHAKKFVPNGN